MICSCTVVVCTYACMHAYIQLRKYKERGIVTGVPVAMCESAWLDAARMMLCWAATGGHAVPSIRCVISQVADNWTSQVADNWTTQHQVQQFSTACPACCSILVSHPFWHYCALEGG